MTKPRIGLDLDGCFSSFSYAYAVLMVNVTGEDKFPKGWRKKEDLLHPCWDWDKHWGYTDEEIAKTWRYIEAKNSTFWHKLPLMKGRSEMLRHVNNLSRMGDATYWLTHRPGASAKLGTERWVYQ